MARKNVLRVSLSMDIPVDPTSPGHLRRAAAVVQEMVKRASENGATVAIAGLRYVTVAAKPAG